MSTGNTERIEIELRKAAATLTERFPGYREALVQAALECITDAADHVDRRLNINQRFGTRIERIAGQIPGAGAEEKQPL
jgi:hypothetical protein